MNNEREFKDLPEGWKWVRLGEVVIENPKSPFKVEDCDNFGNFPFFTSGDNVLRHSHFLVDEENLFIATGGKAKINYFYGKASYSADTYSLKVKDLNTKYIFYTLLKDIEIIDYKFFSGSGLKHLQKDDFKGLSIPLPPLPEQQKIAEIFETIDNAIEKTDKIIEKYKRIKQGLMQDLLTKGIDENGNIRNEKTHKFKDSPLVRIPEEWEVVRLGEMGEIIYGERLNEYEYFEDGSSIVYGTTGIIARTEKYIDVGEAIILPRKGSINNKFYVKEGQKFFVIDTAFYVKFTKTEVYVKYIYYFLHQVNFELLNEATGIPSLNRENLKNILIPLPPLPEQQRIAEILSQIDKTIEKEEQYKEKLKRLKQGLMGDLLTGKVRVNHLVEEEE